jgi:DNA polymerase III subunit delta'
MAFKDILGHERPISLLQRALRSDKVASSYLFAGSEGIGKKKVALELAKALNCTGPEAAGGEACDRCMSCRKVNESYRETKPHEGLHPDVLLLEPANQTLKADQVREMQKELAYRPYEGRRRVCILAAADRMAPNMANILLKTLEEPPLHTVIILLAGSARVMLPTILSRCQILRFNPLPPALVARWLREKAGMEEEEALLLASLSEGSPGRALTLRERLAEIPRGALLREWVAGSMTSFEAIDTWTEAQPKDREELQLVLEVAKTLLRDLVVTQVAGSGSGRLVHADLRGEIEGLAGRWPLETLLCRMDLLHRTALAVSPLRGNANTTLALEAMMLSWA